MLNAPARREVAWDSGVMNYYHPEHRARLPIAMTPGDSLASSISLRRGEKVTYPYHAGTVRGEGDNSPVKIVAVLTCVAEPLPPDAFRPGYTGHDPKIYLARDLRRDLLPHFDRPAEAPDPVKFADLSSAPGATPASSPSTSPSKACPTTPRRTPSASPMPSSWPAASAKARRQGAAAHQRRPDRHRLLRPGPQRPSRLARPRRPRLRPQVPHRLRRRHARRREPWPTSTRASPRPPSARTSRPPTAIAGPAPRSSSPATPASTWSPASAATSSAPAIPGDPTSTCRPASGSPRSSAATPTAGPTPPRVGSPRRWSCGP